MRWDAVGSQGRGGSHFSPVDIPQEPGNTNHSFGMATGMSQPKSEILQGTLDLMVLKTLHAMGPLHGYGIARRIEQISEEALQLNQGTIYASLVRLQQRGWINAEWGTSENNRKAKYYSITSAGRRQLREEKENWERIAGVMARVLKS
jgi:PadR family transcriptional regulator